MQMKDLRAFFFFFFLLLVIDNIGFEIGSLC
jgi:hypothetical protein